MEKKHWRRGPHQGVVLQRELGDCGGARGKGLQRRRAAVRSAVAGRAHDERGKAAGEDKGGEGGAELRVTCGGAGVWASSMGAVESAAWQRVSRAEAGQRQVGGTRWHVRGDPAAFAACTHAGLKSRDSSSMWVTSAESAAGGRSRCTHGRELERVRRTEPEMAETACTCVRGCGWVGGCG